MIVVERQVRFPSQLRLLKTDDFSSVFNFRCAVRGNTLRIHGKPNGLPHARLGLVIGRKLAKQAVRRNYMKRVIRESFRQQQETLAGLDIVVWPREAFARDQYAQVVSELQRLFGKLDKCRACSSH
ncbi:MAG: ribonuclease P protein component [Chitinivorax sp.]